MKTKISIPNIDFSANIPIVEDAFFKVRLENMQLEEISKDYIIISHDKIPYQEIFFDCLKLNLKKALLKLTKKEKKEYFNNWVSKIPYSIWKKYKKNIIQKCAITSLILYNWQIGRTEIPDYQLMIIEKIANKDIFFKENTL